MRVIIAGSRTIVDPTILVSAIEASGFEISLVISGRARGPDTLGELWAQANNIPVEFYPAEWEKYGKSAGYVRNDAMPKVADAAIVLWDGKSAGSKNMIELMRRKNKPCHVLTLS